MIALAQFAYWASILLNGFLCSLLWRKKAYRQYPAFCAYIGFDALITLVLWASYHKPALYLQLWLFGQVVCWILKGFVLAEIIQKVYGFKFAPQFARMSGFLPGWSLAHINIPLQQSLGLGLAALMFVLSLSKREIENRSFWIIVGLAQYSFFSAIVTVLQNCAYQNVLAFVPVFAYTGALGMWIYSFRREA